MAIQTFVFEHVNNIEERKKMLKSALRDHCGVDSAEILYNHKGHPYVKGTPKDCYISVTTVGEVMVCVFSNKPVGIDGEQITKYKEGNFEYLPIAERFFSEDEAEYCRDNDPLKFVKVWIRKEAYCKFTGNGLKDFANFSVSDGDKLYSKINGVPVKKFSPQFPGSSEYMFVIVGDTE